ncbi:DNA/RNA non-specific endonuclease [Deinococcus cellulosilyticus]|nr:DNA/RNA non-specific endonuclease [Deinococcus cellulosilyticus]
MIQQEIQRQTPEDAKYYQAIQQAGGFGPFHLKIMNGDSRELNDFFEKSHLNFVDETSSLEKQAITDCPRLFPPEDRGLRKVGRQLSMIDSIGRPQNAQIWYPPKPQSLYSRVACQQQVGAMGQTGDQGGHLIGYTLSGYNKRANMVPQNGNFNTGYWRVIEGYIRECMNSKSATSVHPVLYRVGVAYPNNTTVRPDRFTLTLHKYKIVLGITTPVPEYTILAVFQNQPQGGPNGPVFAANLRADLRSKNFCL